MRHKIGFVIFSLIVTATFDVSAQWAKPKSPVIPQADGYVLIPHVAIPPARNHVYRAVWDATRAAKSPGELVPALNMAGSELNAFGSTGVPLRNAKFVIVFHGPAVDGILDDDHYKAKFGISNPNLKVLSELKKNGTAIFVCGQHLAAENIDPKTLSQLVTVASDALIVLMAYQNDGYALMSF